MLARNDLYRFRDSNNVPARLFIGRDKLILKFKRKDKGTRIDEIILEKNEMGGNHSTQL